MKILRNTLIVVIIVLQSYQCGMVAFQQAGDTSYNCHNYAWQSTRTWLDDPSAYIAAATECNPQDATKVVYYDGNTPIHSGLYLGGGWVESKWGQYPIVTHPTIISPYGHNVRYYQ